MQFAEVSPVPTDDPEFPEFAKNKWIEVFSDPDTSGIFAKLKPKFVPGRYRPVIDHINQLQDKMSGLHIFVMNEMYTRGFKSIKPTVDQCITLQNIEVNVSLVDYKQPFDVVLIEIPEGYRRYLSQTYGHVGPKYVVVYRPTDKELMLGSVSFGMNKELIGFFATENCDSIEKLPSECVKFKDDPAFTIAHLAQRVAFNLMLLATNYGYEKLGYENIKQHRHRERKNPALAKQDPYYIGLNQKLKLRSEQVERATSDEILTGSPKRPHWRRGYWRQQRYGVGYSLTRAVFIKPVFVKSELFHGSLSDTTVLMQGTS